MAWGVNNNGWWGEGEIKFFIDGDNKFPTICGTGTEDYFCGSYNFEPKKNDAGVEEVNYTEFCTPYSGLHQVIRPDGHYNVTQRFGLYRWHILDPIRFEKDLKITIQDLGWNKGEGTFLKNQIFHLYVSGTRQSLMQTSRHTSDCRIWRLINDFN